MGIPTMTNLPSFLTFFLILLLHLGCFFFTTPKHLRTSKKSPKPPHSLKHKTTKALSSTWSFLKQILHKPIPSPSLQPGPKPELIELPCLAGAEISSDSHPLRNDIYPCPVCGEIFQIPNFLEHHKTTKHAVSELPEGDSGKNIVCIIFSSGWPNKAQAPTIYRILKIHNSPKILTRFETHREMVQARAANERCIADGNEVLRFYCTTFVCDIGRNGNSSVCRGEYCSLCGIIRSGFSPKMDAIATLPTSWKAHLVVPEDIEEEFGVRRAVLVCRVVAGRVGCGSMFGGRDDIGFDSVMGSGVGFGNKLESDDELLVFNPIAVLPCFVILYTV